LNALDEHLGYVSDGIRLDAFRSAIAQTVRDGFVVADLGCGTGVLGLMCLQAGAAKLFAVDSSAMIDVARASFSRTSYSQRVSFFNSHSTRTELPERVDLVVCDQVGYFGFDAGIVQYFADAYRRFLKPGGTLVPARIRILAAAVESTLCYRLVTAWNDEAVPCELRWLREYAVNTEHPVYIGPGELLGSPVLLGEIALGAADPRSFSWSVELPIGRDGSMHGVVGWFECELADGVWMTNSPLAARAIRRPQAFLPIRDPLPAHAGEKIALSVVARPCDEIVAWTIECEGGRRFRHATWAGMPLSQAHLTSVDPGRSPRPNSEGRARMVVLGYCDGMRTAREIEQQVHEYHPDLFPSPEETARFVRQVLAKDADVW
jgi:protein arginine N-methyltransferase 1